MTEAHNYSQNAEDGSFLQAEVVEIGFTPFLLFPKGKTEKVLHKSNIYSYTRVILLDTRGSLPYIPIRLSALVSVADEVNTLSPYTNGGYVYTGNETNSIQREKYLDALDKDALFDTSEANLILFALSHENALRIDSKSNESQEEIDFLLQNVRFQISLPRRDSLKMEHPYYEKFISRPTKRYVQNEQLHFMYFTPQEMPKLSLPEKYSRIVNEGHYLFIPSEDTIIENIYGQIMQLPAGASADI